MEKRWCDGPIDVPQEFYYRGTTLKAVIDIFNFYGNKMVSELAEQNGQGK